MQLAVFLVLTFMLAVPLINYGFYSWAHDRAYRDFVSPQHDNRVVVLNSRLLPKYKFDLLGERLPPTPEEFLLVYGNSTQFHLRESVFQEYLNCELKNFYNMSHHSIDYLDAKYFFREIGESVGKGWTILLGVYPDMFTKTARGAAPSIDHPWNNLALWAANIRDGNTSVASMFPRLLNIEWPINPSTWFPFLQQYQNTFDLAMVGKPDEYLYRDGSVQFIAADQERRERVAAGIRLDANNFRMIAARHLRSPFDPNLLGAFRETVSALVARGAQVIAYEAELTEYLGGSRWERPEHTVAYLQMMAELQQQHSEFAYLNRQQTWVGIPEEWWLDGSHVSFEGGRHIVERLSQLIPAGEMCRTGSSGASG